VDALVFGQQSDDGELAFDAQLKINKHAEEQRSLMKHKILYLCALISVSHTMTCSSPPSEKGRREFELLPLFCELLRRFSNGKANSLGWLFGHFSLLYMGINLY
jgi:hypothetical protein